MQILSISFKQIAGPTLVFTLIVLTYLGEPQTGHWLAFDRSQMELQQVWRWLTANVVHTNGYHMLLNSLAIGLLWLLHGYSYTLSRYLFVVFVCSLFVTLGVWWFSEELQWYAGLSGALHGVFIWGCYNDLKQGHKSAWLLVGGVILKIAYEQFWGASSWLEGVIAASVATDAHLYGFIGGLVCILIIWLTNKKNAAD